MNSVDKLLAKKLLGISAVKLQPKNPFTWASGWKSPIYTDNRKTLSFPDVRTFVKIELSRLIAEKFEEFDVIAGVATGAIAQGAMIADELGMPYVYIRSAAKDDTVRLKTPRDMSLEECIAFLNDDEYLEVTPHFLRLRKRFLKAKDRVNYAKSQNQG